MKILSWEVKIGIVLILISITIYTIKFVILGDPKESYIFILNALGFIPIEVLIVTLIIHQLLIMQSNKEKMEKLNMVIGTFFSEVGTKLLVYFSDLDPDLDKIRRSLIVSNDWSDDDFNRIRQELKQHKYVVNVDPGCCILLKTFLVGQRGFLLSLLENPVLLEHAEFTEILYATFHLAEELYHRDDMTNLPATDYDHLAGDIQRAYGQLVSQWLEYMRYLKNNYPYLFSLAMRKNPFDKTASPIVRK
jgi:hypothetical protein